MLYKVIASIFPVLAIVFGILWVVTDQTTNLRSVHKSLDHAYTCVHDLINENVHLEIPNLTPLPYKETQEYQFDLIRNGVEVTWRQMKILLDYSNVETTPELSAFIEKDLINYAIQYLTNIYKVYPTERIDEMKGRHKCGSLNIPKDHQENGVEDYDLVIYVGTKYGIHEPWMSASERCFLSRRDLRAVAGSIVVNTWHLGEMNIASISTDSTLLWQGILIHEMTHLLGFTGNTWKMIADHRNINIVTRKDDQYYIIDPTVVEMAKKYWNCSDVFGVPLESQGGPGSMISHWDKSSFSPEIMTAASVTNFYYSQFTAMVLQATQWYLVNMDFVMQLEWGKGEGCEFANAQCQPSETILEFCSPDTPPSSQQCTHDYFGRAQCFSHMRFFQKCGLWDERIGHDCRDQDGSKQFATQVDQLDGEIGGQSRCFMVQDHGVSCYKAQCNSDSITFNVKGNSYSCGRDDAFIQVTIGGEKLEIQCPVFDRFCSQDWTGCPESCNERGNCQNGQCQCNPGFTGTSCELKSG